MNDSTTIPLDKYGVPVHVLDMAHKEGLTRKSNPIEKDGVKNIRTALYDWDQICGEDEAKKSILQTENICIQLVIRSFPYDPYDEDGLFIEITTMGEKWSNGIKAMSNFYDKDTKLFKLWLRMNLVHAAPFFYQYMIPFEILFKTLGSYKKLEKDIGLLEAVHHKHNLLHTTAI
jgi:hypothetical protein